MSSKVDVSFLLCYIVCTPFFRQSPSVACRPSHVGRFLVSPLFLLFLAGRSCVLDMALTYLVIGANRGLGLEFVKQLVSLPCSATSDKD